jgi:aldehyde dehydrogenase (NAD+)
MKEHLKFYIGGRWVEPLGTKTIDVINPATEQVVGRVSLGTAEDVGKAVAAARKAFETYSQTTKQERIALIERIQACYQERLAELAETVTLEMGAPKWLATAAQAPVGLAHIAQTLEVLKKFEFEEQRGTTRIVKEPVGVCGFITPWNWPINQVMCKVMPALAAGCTMVLKPSEIAPLSGYLFAQIMHEAGVPAGVFNLVNGDGPTVGAALSSHPGIDMVSFTGSTRAGRRVSELASATVKPVAMELGGKSPNVILDDADLARAVPDGVAKCYLNSGQTCSALTRMLVPREKLGEAEELAKSAAEAFTPGDPFVDSTRLGPLVSDVQRERVRGYIEKGEAEGAKLVTGGAAPPEGLERGYFVRPTVFSEVTPEMAIAQEEIFGPVLAIQPYEDEDDAVRIANDSVYGLAGGVWSADQDRAISVAKRIRTGQIEINGGAFNPLAPFGGYKQSGHGRENGRYAIEELLQVKSLQL